MPLNDFQKKILVFGKLVVFKTFVKVKKIEAQPFAGLLKSGKEAINDNPHWIRNYHQSCFISDLVLYFRKKFWEMLKHLCPNLKNDFSVHENPGIKISTIISSFAISDTPNFRS